MDEPNGLEVKDLPEADRVRPQYLSILCVLTWVWNSISVVAGAVLLASTSDLSVAFNVLGKELSPYSDTIEQDILWLGSEGLALVIAAFILFALLNLLAASMIWKLQKKGFYLYVGTNFILMMGFFVLQSQFMGMLCAGFIALYGKDLKIYR